MKYRLKRGFTLIELLVVIAIIAILAAISVNTARYVYSIANTNKVMNNMNNILTVITVYRQDRSALPVGTGSNSNDHFRELFVENYLNSGDEILFYVPDAAVCTVKPDSQLGGAGAPDALEAGTCGFAYVANLDSNTNTGAPIMMDAFVDGTNFDRNLHSGKVLVGNLTGGVIKATARGAQAIGPGDIDLADVTAGGIYGEQSNTLELLQPTP